MKKIAIILMVLIMGIGNDMAKEKKVGGYVIFGRASQDCTNFGLCKMRLEIFGIVFGYNIDAKGGTVKPADAVTVETSINENNNTYTLTFSISELKQKNPTKVAELDKGKFYVDEDITFASNANNAYGLKRTKPITLKAGTYDIRKTGDIATVIINIR
jgi:hypothetical protein